LVIVGGATTLNVADAVVPVVVGLVEVTVPVVLTLLPAVDEVTVAVTVQLAPPLIDAPGSLIDVEVEVETDPLVHVVAAPVCVMPVGRLSVTATPVSVVLAFGLVMVRVSVEVPPDAMVPRLKPFVIVGAETTVTVGEVAIFVRVPPLPSLVAVVNVLVPAVDGAVTVWPVVP
jgi:hypothetical protein